MLWKAVHFVLGPDLLPIHDHVKDAPPALDELGVDAETLLDFIRQTGGFGKIVSLHAIGDRNLHLSAPLSCLAVASSCTLWPNPFS